MSGNTFQDTLLSYISVLRCIRSQKFYKWKETDYTRALEWSHSLTRLLKEDNIGEETFISSLIDHNIHVTPLEGLMLDPGRIVLLMEMIGSPFLSSFILHLILKDVFSNSSTSKLNVEFIESKIQLMACSKSILYSLEQMKSFIKSNDSFYSQPDSILERSQARLLSIRWIDSLNSTSSMKRFELFLKNNVTSNYLLMNLIYWQFFVIEENTLLFGRIESFIVQQWKDNIKNIHSPSGDRVDCKLWMNQQWFSSSPELLCNIIAVSGLLNSFFHEEFINIFESILKYLIDRNIPNYNDGLDYFLYSNRFYILQRLHTITVYLKENNRMDFNTIQEKILKIGEEMLIGNTGNVKIYQLQYFWNLFQK